MEDQKTERAGTSWALLRLTADFHSASIFFYFLQIGESGEIELAGSMRLQMPVKFGLYISICISPVLWGHGVPTYDRYNLPLSMHDMLVLDVVGRFPKLLGYFIKRYRITARLPTLHRPIGRLGIGVLPLVYSFFDLFSRADKRRNSKRGSELKMRRIWV